MWRYSKIDIYDSSSHNLGNVVSFLTEANKNTKLNYKIMEIERNFETMFRDRKKLL